MGEHIFMEYIFFRMTCSRGIFLLREAMLCMKKCIVGGHVLLGVHVFRIAYLYV